MAFGQWVVGSLATASANGISDPKIRDWFLVGIWPFVIIVGLIAFVVWVWRGDK